MFEVSGVMCLQYSAGQSELSLACCSMDVGSDEAWRRAELGIGILGYSFLKFLFCVMQVHTI